jgi:hypothetical protein
VGPFDDLDPVAHGRRQPAGVAHDHADGRLRGEQPGEELPADLAGGRGDNDHAELLRSSELRAMTARLTLPSEAPRGPGLKDRSGPH